MKICLYLEYLHFFNGFLYKNIGTGLLSSYDNQKRSLRALNIDFTEKWADDCDILQINTPWLKSLWLIKKARRQGKKVIIWAHVAAEEIPEVFRFGKLLFPIAKRYLAYAYGQADLVFCPSEYTKRLMLGYGLPEKILFVQSNGVDSSVFYPSAEKRAIARQQQNCQKLVVGTVGLVIPRKGVDKFLALAQKHPNQQFLWFGKIYSKLIVKGLPKVLPNNVKFTGFVEDINAAFNAIDIFVFLSSGENQGMVLLEAAACGLPMVVRALPAYEGWLVHNENCLIAKDEKETNEYLDLLIKDEELRKKLSHGALELAKTEDIKEQNKKLQKVYLDLLAK
ncbi:MAG TPA: glycosyltransferase family 4 protein [Candidatus Portnoybacteria bacterium]|nr:glycosyltransferase family 4 protein [Candidatus Portnoybacteria bacterium]